MTYYYAGLSYSPNDLAHHGVKGQKWGVRRYQNTDGTLTAEGKKRYGNLGEYGSKHGVMRRLATGDVPVGFLSRKRIGDKMEERYRRKSEEAKKLGTEIGDKRSKNYEQLYEAQKAKNIDRDKYVSRTSTGKLIAQNFLLGIGGDSYRVARERGEDRISAGAAAIGGMLAGRIGVYAVDFYKSKKAYGKLTF